jgi:hypothetical protein
MFSRFRAAALSRHGRGGQELPTPRSRGRRRRRRPACNKVALGGISAQGGGRRRRQKDRRAQPDARTRGESSAGGRAIIARLRMMTPPGEVCSLETRGYLFPAEVDRRACSQRLEELSRSRICVKRRRDRAMLSPIRSSAEPGGGAGIVRAAGGLWHRNYTLAANPCVPRASGHKAARYRKLICRQRGRRQLHV